MWLRQCCLFVGQEVVGIFNMHVHSTFQMKSFTSPTSAYTNTQLSLTNYKEASLQESDVFVRVRVFICV